MSPIQPVARTMSSSSTANRGVSASIGKNSNASSPPTGKASSAPPKITTQEDDMELKNIKSDGAVGASLPIEEDIMQLARLGEVASIQRLFESGTFDAKHHDDEGITPLHVSDFRGACFYLFYIHTTQRTQHNF